MAIHVTRMRHTEDMRIIEKLLRRKMHGGAHYIAIIYDGPESIIREASWTSSAKDQDVKAILEALHKQIEL